MNDSCISRELDVRFASEALIIQIPNLGLDHLLVRRFEHIIKRLELPGVEIVLTFGSTVWD
jgi:hypothetical protein